jgi:hypothetical protein
MLGILTCPSRPLSSAMAKSALPTSSEERRMLKRRVALGLAINKHILYDTKVCLLMAFTRLAATYSVDANLHGMQIR